MAPLTRKQAEQFIANCEAISTLRRNMNSTRRHLATDVQKLAYLKELYQTFLDPAKANKIKERIRFYQTRLHNFKQDMQYLQRGLAVITGKQLKVGGKFSLAPVSKIEK